MLLFMYRVLCLTMNKNIPTFMMLNYNLVRKTDMYQVTYKYKMTRADIYGEEKYKNEGDVIKLP